MPDTLQLIKLTTTSLSIYRNLQRDPVIADMSALLDCDSVERLAFLWGRMFEGLSRSKFSANFADYVFEKALYDENVFTKAASRSLYITLPKAVRATAQRDLTALGLLASVSSEELKARCRERFPNHGEAVDLLPDWVSKNSKYDVKTPWGEDIQKLADFARHNGCGNMARYDTFRFCPDAEDFLRPVLGTNPVTLRQLTAYTPQKDKLRDTAEALLEDKPVQSLLLYGGRGTGKTSFVRALLNEYKGRGLRLIELAGAAVPYVDSLLPMLEESPLKFILFFDDLNLSSPCRAALSDLMAALPQNVWLCAAASRENAKPEPACLEEELLPENGGDAAAMAGIFGDILCFPSLPASQLAALTAEICAGHGFTPDPEQLETAVSRWSARRGPLTPRSARQLAEGITSAVSRGQDFL